VSARYALAESARARTRSAACQLLHILAFGLISNSIVSLFIPVFAALKEQFSLLLSNVFKLVLCIILLPISIHFFGVFGIAVESY